MITREQYARHIVAQFCEEQDIGIDELGDSDILSSSGLAVAMEYLGMLQVPEMIQYAAGRGGCVVCRWVDDGVRHLSVRELMGLLPETYP